MDRTTHLLCEVGTFGSYLQTWLPQDRGTQYPLAEQRYQRRKQRTEIRHVGDCTGEIVRRYFTVVSLHKESV